MVIRRHEPISAVGNRRPETISAVGNRRPELQLSRGMRHESLSARGTRHESLSARVLGMKKKQKRIILHMINPCYSDIRPILRLQLKLPVEMRSIPITNAEGRKQIS